MHSPTPLSTASVPPSKPFNVWAVVVVAALGYFVDVYDLLLFLIVRDPSLTGLGYRGDEVLRLGTTLFNWQMSGLLVGGILWGILGDRRGRLTVLFGSIFLYSIANVANGFVTEVTWYAALRFIAGIGLAGELGAGITLVSELMTPRMRGWGTTIIASIGLLGAVAANRVAGTDWGSLLGLSGAFWGESWRIAYMIGGGMGLLLLALRIRVSESGMFEAAEKSQVERGNFLRLFSHPSLRARYLRCIAIGLPTWYLIGVLVGYSNAIGLEAGTPGVIVGEAVMWAYLGISAGDLSSGILSQLLGSRKRAVLAFLLLAAVVSAAFLSVQQAGLSLTYAICFAMGYSGGYWAVFVTIASEQFGTNIRATVTTTVPNFVRGAVVPMTLLYGALYPHLSHHGAAAVVGVIAIGISLWALSGLPETFGKDLDYYEVHDRL